MIERFLQVSARFPASLPRRSWTTSLSHTYQNRSSHAFKIPSGSPIAKAYVPEFSRVEFLVADSASLRPIAGGCMANDWSETALRQPDPQEKNAIRCQNYTRHAFKTRYQVSLLYMRISPYFWATLKLLSPLSTYRPSQAISLLALSQLSLRQTSPRWLETLKRRAGASVAWLG
jgi:hypothetical protein